jgi:WD40 repeat protein
VGSIEVGPVDIWTVAFSPDDKFIISGSHSGKISLYGVESGKQEQTLDTRGKFTLSIAYVSRELVQNNALALATQCYKHLDVCVANDVPQNIAVH